MKRTKQWWSKLTPDERATLVFIEKSDKQNSSPYGAGGYLPDDCSECRACGQAQLGTGLCLSCLNTLNRIIEKADAGVMASFGAK